MAGPIAAAADDAQRQVLAIGAQQGDQGVAEFDQALKNVQSIRDEALARAGLQAGQIAAPTGSQQEMAALFTRPTATAEQQLQVGKANFQGNIGRSSYDTIGYLGKMKAVEPLVDKYIAAKAAADAAGSGGGGGGSGGGGGGGDKPLSDSELRTQLTGAASQTRESDIAAAAGQLQQQGQARAQARTMVKQQSRVVQSRVRALAKSAERLQKAAQAYNDKGKGGGRRRAFEAAQADQKARLAVFLRSQQKLGQYRQGSQAAAQVQRRLYGNTLATAHAPLGDYAREIGVAAGEDPNRVYGLIGPTQDKSFLLADQARDKNAGGPLGLIGRVPKLGPRAVASEIKVTPQKAQVMRASKNYHTVASYVEQALADGHGIAEVSRGLEGWRQPTPRLHKKGALKGQPVKQNGKVVYDAPAHAHLVDLVLSDYSPAFGR